MTNKRPIIIDCDPGHDDAIALILACKNERLDVKAVTICAGNQTLDKTVNNALKVLSYAGITNIPVAAGFKKPIVRELITAPEVHGESGLDGPELPEPTISLSDCKAIDLIADIVKNSEEKITLVPLGPLTNIAMFIKVYPELLDKIELISLMGGAANGGNWTPSAEFNILVDPEAAHIVFSSGIPIAMAGLDVTHKANIYMDDIERIRNIGNKVGIMVADLLDFFAEYHVTDNFKGCHLHDPVAITYLIKPELIKTIPFHVDIELHGTHTTGRTVVDYYDRLDLPKNVNVMVGINREGFVDLLVEEIEKYD